MRDGERCKSCRFYCEIDPDAESEYYPDAGWGQCHRNPPVLVGTDEQEKDAKAARDDGGGLWGEWPRVLDVRWCGEWKAIPKE